MDPFVIKTIDDQPIYKRKLVWLIVSFFLIIILIVIIVVTTSSSGNSKNNNQETSNKEFIPYICLDEKNNPSNNCLGGWFYKIRYYNPEYNAKFAKSKNWNYVFLSLSIDSKTSRENIKAFRAQNISVHFMTLEDTVYLYDPQTAYDHMEKLLLDVNNNSLDIQGIHIDVEPHATDEWKSGDSNLRKEIFKNYTKVIENCRKAINKYRPNTTLSAAVGWFYSSRTKKNEIEGGRGYELVNKDKLDFLVPMIYDGAGNNLDDIIKHSEDYINDKANSVIGLDVRYHGDNLENIINQVVEYRKNSSYFYGISIFSNHHYSDWGSEL